MVRSDLTLLTDEQLDSVTGGSTNIVGGNVVVPNNNNNQQPNNNFQVIKEDNFVLQYV